jgi:HK97 family phage prohead protease
MKSDPNESEADFLDRCALALLDDGTADDRDEAEALCEEMWAKRDRGLDFERRSSPLEIRARGRKLEGYAATFGVEAKLPGFTEVLSPGAFAASLRNDIVALMDHDTTKMLARTRSKTLRLSEDSKGLAFDLDIPSTTTGNDVLALAERGDLGGMSFGFTVGKDGEHWDGSKRTLRAIDLREISVVSAWPAYEGTVVTARAKKPVVLRSFSNLRLALAKRYIETL